MKTLLNTLTTTDRVLAQLPLGVIEFPARILLAMLFILAGYGKIGGYEGNLAYMASQGVPGSLLPAVIALELLGGLALVIGFQTRLVALLLALFSAVSAIVFHAELADQMHFVMFFKNLSIAGGLLFLVINGPSTWTLDHQLSQLKA